MLTLLTLASVLTFADADKDKKEAPNGDLAALQGVWRITESESRGRVSTRDRPGLETFRTLVINGDEYVFTSHAGTIKLDPTQRTADLKIAKGPRTGETLLGRYNLAGDTLKLALPPVMIGGARPAELKTDPNSSFTVYTFTKDATITKEAVATKHQELVANLPATNIGTRTLQNPNALQRILDRLDQIDKRLEALEKRLPEKK